MWKQYRWVYLWVLVAVLMACQREPVEKEVFSVRDVVDPAMDRVEPKPETLSTAEKIDRSEQSGSEPDEFEVDVPGRRVYLPGKGWLSAEVFWEIYYESPQLLPGEIDHQVLQKIR